MRNDIVIAVDLAKSVFECGVSDRPGHICRRERPRRDQFLSFFLAYPGATVVMEACGSAHYWGRELQKRGHRIVLLPPHHVRPYVRGNKTDRTDVKGILEAYRNADIRPVPVKSVAQQSLATLHRMRAGWMTERTARLNAVRGLLRELGIFIPLGAREVIPAVWAEIGDAKSELPPVLRRVFAEACQEIRDIEARIKKVDQDLEALSEQTPAVVWLLTIPGIGLLTATALVAFLGDIRRFPSGRHLASYLGLTPREYSSGLKRRLGRISKRGDGYLRTLLIHGARSVLVHARKQQPDRLRAWAHALAKTHVHNKAAVAVANKLARIVWAVWTRNVPYALIPKAA
ncbi:MAG TPA: IS110 family transposase [Candidatus Methylomirabilis sp.]|nr:IS110 family transposase [Candidatus Methylomirabilis sp.]